MEFLEEITSHLSGTAGAFLALIGPEWLDTHDRAPAAGDKDYVVQEIELGLQNGWTFIPVLAERRPLAGAARLFRRRSRRFRGRQAAQLAHDQPGQRHRRSHGAPRRDRRPPAGRSPAARPSTSTLGSGPPDDTGGTETRAPEILSIDDEHYETLIEEADNLVIFLGARANVDDQERPLPSGPTMPPDDTGLADYLATKARMKSGRARTGGGRAVRPDVPRRIDACSTG